MPHNVPQYTVSQRNARPISRNPQRTVPRGTVRQRNEKVETSSICLRRAATTPADFALQNFHAMFFDKQKITCDPLRIFSAALLETEFCLRCGTEFSRKDFVKREKRCVTNVALRYLLVEIPL